MNEEQYKEFLIEHGYITTLNRGLFQSYWETYNEFNSSTLKVYDREEGDALALSTAKNIELYWKPTSLVKCEFKHVTQLLNIKFDLFPKISMKFSVGVSEKYLPLWICSAITETLVVYDNVSIEAMKKILYALQYYQMSNESLLGLLKWCLEVKPSMEEMKWKKQLKTFSVSFPYYSTILEKLTPYEMKRYEKQMDYLSSIEDVFPLILKHKPRLIKNVLLINVRKCLIENTQRARIRQLSFYLSHNSKVFRRLLFLVMKDKVLLRGAMFELPQDVVNYIEYFCVWLYLAQQ